MFVFGETSGNDHVMDFDPLQAGEVINLSAVTDIPDYADLVSHHLTEVNGNAVISWAAGTVTLQGVHVSDLSSGDFLF